MQLKIKQLNLQKSIFNKHWKEFTKESMNNTKYILSTLILSFILSPKNECLELADNKYYQWTYNFDDPQSVILFSQSDPLHLYSPSLNKFLFWALFHFYLLLKKLFFVNCFDLVMFLHYNLITLVSNTRASVLIFFISKTLWN
jgi:hypothetical protein